ncbi:MAG: 50S ribosomal protein L31e [Candidatus Bathyarchaeia archaeon]
MENDQETKQIKDEKIKNEEIENEENVAEEEKVEAKKYEAEKREEGEVAEERFYNVPLGRAWLVPSRKRAAKAMRILIDFVRRHMKLKTEEMEEEAESKKLIIDNKVNEWIWRKGAESPPRKIRIRAVKYKDGNVKVYLAEGD